MMASALSDLPNELIDEIFSYFDPLTDRQSLLHACSVSHAVCAAAQPVLFHTFKFLGEQPQDQNASYAWELSAPKDQLISFTSTIIQRPDLAAHVKDIYIEVFDDDSYSYLGEAALPSDSDMDVCIKAISTAAYSASRPEWIDAIAQKNANAVASLLISQLPNLEVLSFIMSYDSMEVLSAVAQQASFFALNVDRAHFPLANLKKLELSYFEAGNTYSLSEIESFLALPLLQRVCLQQCHGGEYSVSPNGDGDSVLLNIDSITLWKCCLDVVGTKDLLHACKALKYFEYEPSPFYEVGHTQHISPSGLLIVLASHKSSLEELRLDFKGEDTDNWEDVGGSYDIGSLTHFTALRHLVLAQDQLPHPSKWPSSIQVVTINHCSEPITELMTELCAFKRLTLMSLFRIEVFIAVEMHHIVFGLDEQRRDRSEFDDAVAEKMATMSTQGIEFAMKINTWELNYMAGRVKDGWGTVDYDLTWYNPDKARHVFIHVD